MTAHTTPPDQTAAAQEREALMLFSRPALEQIQMSISGGLCYVSAEAKHCQLNDAKKQIDNILSTQQPEPCVDELEALKADARAYAMRDFREGAWGVTEAEIVEDVFIFLDSRSLLTGRTEAKAVERIEGLEYAIEQADRNTDESPIQDSDVRILAKAAERYLRLQEAEAHTQSRIKDNYTGSRIEAKAEGDMVMVPRKLTDDMFVAFAEKWFSKTRCIDDCEMEDCYEAMLKAAPISAAPPFQQDCCVPRRSEPSFVLLGRDLQAPDLVDQWANERERRDPSDLKIGKARTIAEDMRDYAARQREQQPADTGDGRG